MRRTKGDWQELIEQQQGSGLTAAQFCREHSINAKYFSARKHQLAASSTPFVHVTPSRVRAVDGASLKMRVIEIDVPSAALLDSLSLLLGKNER